MLGLAGPAPAELRPTPLGLGSTQLGKAWLGSTWPGVAWLGFGSSRVGLDWLGPALISSDRHAVAPGLRGPVLLHELDWAQKPPRLLFPLLQHLAVESQVTVKNKLLGPAPRDPSWLGSACVGWDVAQLGPAQPVLAWPFSGLDSSAWQLGGSDGRLGSARLCTSWPRSAEPMTLLGRSSAWVLSKAEEYMNGA